MNRQRICSALLLTTFVWALPGCGEGRPVTLTSGANSAASPESGASNEDLSAVECVIKAEKVWGDGDHPQALKLYDLAIRKTADNPPQMQIFAARKAELAKSAP